MQFLDDFLLGGHQNQVSSFSAPRVQHLLRCSPSVATGLATFDELLFTALCVITNSSHKQSAGDRPGLQAARESVEISKSDPWKKQLS